MATVESTYLAAALMVSSSTAVPSRRPAFLTSERALTLSLSPQCKKGIMRGRRNPTFPPFVESSCLLVLHIPSAHRAEGPLRSRSPSSTTHHCPRQHAGTSPLNHCTSRSATGLIPISLVGGGLAAKFYYLLVSPAICRCPYSSTLLPHLLQTNADLVNDIAAVTFAGVAAPYVFGQGPNDRPSGLEVDLSGFSSVSLSTPLVVTLSGTYAVPDICNVPTFGTQACPYTLIGVAASECCPSSSV